MGNKISIRDKFEPFLGIQDPNQALAALKEILAQPIVDDDAREVMTTNILRKYIIENTEAFKATLIECINHVFYVAGTEKVLTEAETLTLNNTLLLLIRFLPILHEENLQKLTKDLLWTKTAFPQNRVAELKQGPYVMEDCLAIKLMHSLFRLMFHPDYTVSSKRHPEPRKLVVGKLQADMRVFWKGFDNFRHENDNTKFYYNRTKVLECLLACFSAPLLSPLNPEDRSTDPWIQYCVSPYNSLLLSALISMMSFGMSYEENYTVPYTQYIISDVNGEKLALLCLQLFGLFSDVKINDAALYQKVLERQEYQHIVEHYLKVKEQKLSVESSELNNTQTSKDVLQNACLVFLTELRLTECYEFISRHVLRILKNPYDVENTFLIESRKKTILLEEILLIFWRFIEFNRTYVQRAMYFADFLQLIVHLIYQIHESFTYASKSSVFYIAIIILSKLSCDRSFSIQMKKKFMNDIGFTRIPIFIGSHIDLLFIVLLNGMVDSYVNGYFCYQNNLLAILHNVGPFAKDLSPITTSLLVQLVKATANPKVLRVDKNNLLILRKTLNLIHKILCYQPETCQNLLYELLSQAKELELLKTLPLKKIYGFKQSSTANQSRIDQSKADPSQSITKASDVVVSVKEEKPQEKPEEEEESKGEPQPKTGEKSEHDIVQKNPSPVKVPPAQIQLFDEKWMELFANNVANDLIFLVIDYLQEQLRVSYRERNSGVEEEVKGFLQEQSILGIVPQPGPIMVEVVNDPDNINNNLYLFLWQQIFLKSNGSPHFEPSSAKLLGIK